VTPEQKIAFGVFSLTKVSLTSGLKVCLAGLLIYALSACKDENSVVIYTSVDRHYAEPILQAFEDQTGISVEALYDVEAAKTTGLVNKLIAEADRPRADVFWNGEFLQTQLLAQDGVLSRYAPTQTGLGWQESEQLWTSFGGRARVLIVNTAVLPNAEWPATLSDFLSDRWRGDQLAIAHPLFGTSATHAAALYAAWGRTKAQDFYRSLLARGVRIVDGNSVVRDLAVSGEITFGLTDTDDACSAISSGADVAVLFPDQREGGLGTLVIPNTVALIAGAPHSENGKRLIDYLLSESVVEALAEAGWFHINGTEVLVSDTCGLPKNIRPMPTNPATLHQSIETAKQELRDIFVQ